MKAWALALSALLLVGCTGKPAPVVPEPPDTPRITLKQTADGGFRLEAESGDLGALQWEGPDRFTFAWFGAGGSPRMLYLADLGSGQVHRLGEGETVQGFVHPSGKHAVLVTGTSGKDLRVDAVQLESGDSETVFAFDRAVPQWASAADRTWAFGEVGAAVQVQWLSEQSLLITLTPQDQRNVQNWGQVMRIDLARKQVKVVAQRGAALALPADGELAEAALLQTGWVDGPLTVALSDGASAGKELAPAGLWKRAATRGSGEPVVAWLELEAPAGDWSDRLPHACCSGDPQPHVRSVVLWHRAGGWVRRVPAHTASTWDSPFVLQDGSVVYAAVPEENGVRTEIYRVDTEGHQTRLAVHDWRGRFHLWAEGPDGSLYYTLTGRSGQNPSTLVRRSPDGKTEELWEGFLESAVPTNSHLVLNPAGQPNILVDLKSGKLTTGSAGRPSPDGRWTLSGGLPDQPRTVQVSPIKL